MEKQSKKKAERYQNNISHTLEISAIRKPIVFKSLKEFGDFYNRYTK